MVKLTSRLVKRKYEEWQRGLPSGVTVARYLLEPLNDLGLASVEDAFECHRFWLVFARNVVNVA